MLYMLYAILTSPGVPPASVFPFLPVRRWPARGPSVPAHAMGRDGDAGMDEGPPFFPPSFSSVRRSLSDILLCFFAAHCAITTTLI